MAAARQTGKRLADIVQLNIVRQLGKEVRINRFYRVLGVDVVVYSEANVPAGAAIWRIETESLRVARVAGVIVIRRWSQIDQRLTSRINRSTSLSQNINSQLLSISNSCRAGRLTCNTAGCQICEVTGAGCRGQNCSKRREVLGSIGIFVEEIEEEFVLLNEMLTAFARSW